MKNQFSPQVSEPLYFSAPGFSCKKVFHGFFGRSGGVSTGVYSSLNCGIGSEDEPEMILQNRKIVSEIAGCRHDHLLSVFQVHGNTCLNVTEPWSVFDRPEADGMVTDVPGLGLGIMTADCAPVLFSAEKADGSPVIGAAHAGWGGAFEGVLENTVQALKALGADPATLKAAIGPCIGQSSYEVSSEFEKNFLRQNKENEKFFMPARKEGHSMFDLSGYCAKRLAEAGVRNVFIRDLDTYFNEDDFFSYRRKTHRAEKDYGRQISVIVISK